MVRRAPGFASSGFLSGWLPVIALAAGLSLGAGACHPYRPPPVHPENPPGTWYVVEKGETLEQIAGRIGVPVEDILELNGLARASDVTPGSIIYLLQGRGSSPGALAGRAGGPGDDAASRAQARSGTPPLPPASLMHGSLGGAGGARFRWPLDRTNVGSPFGTRDGRSTRASICRRPRGRPCTPRATDRSSTQGPRSVVTEISWWCSTRVIC